MSTQSLALNERAVTVPVRLARRLPFEVWMSFVFVLVWLAGAAAGLPVSFPNLLRAKLSYARYVVPLILTAVAQAYVVMVLARRRRERFLDADPFLALKMLPVNILMIFIFFNLKAWTPLVNPLLYDETYQAIDVFFAPLVNLFTSIRVFIARLVDNADDLYVGLYILPFIISPIVSAFKDGPRRQRQIIFGACLVSYLGGVTYWIAPAVGPFVYREGLNAVATQAQHIMLEQYLQVRATGILPPHYFFGPPAAMPSLHIAHALFFTLYARRTSPILFGVYLSVLFWITIECVVSAWHYLIDIPAGVGIALLACYLVKRFIPENPGLPVAGRA